MKRLALVISLAAGLLAGCAVLGSPGPTPASSAPASASDPNCTHARHLEEWFWQDVTDLDAHTVGNDSGYATYVRQRIQQFHAAFEAAAAACPAMNP